MAYSSSSTTAVACRWVRVDRAMTFNESPFTQDAFSSFNARAVPAGVLAKDFIPPVQFATLTRRAHTVIVGPRGSGKTTLLKMLTPEALRDSDQSVSLQDQPGVGFTGVFVPTDISWSAQLDAYRGL